MPISQTRILLPDLALGLLVGAIMGFSTAPRRFPRGHRGDLAFGWVNHFGAVGWVLIATGCVLMVLAIAFRRLYPLRSWLTALAAIVAFGAVGGPTFPGLVLGAALTFFTLVRRVPQRTAIWLGLLMAPAFWASWWSKPRAGLDEPESILTLVAASTLAALPALIGLLITARRASSKQEHAAALRKVAFDERIRIARDIHDVVGHSLSLIALQSGVALRVLEDNPSQARASLEAIRGAARTSMDELRHTLAVFRTPDGAELAPTPGLTEVGSLIESVRATGRTVTFNMEIPAETHVPEAIQLVAHRVIQEGLTNAVKHAPNAALAVDLTIADSLLLVSVSNDGPAPAQLTEGLGLRGMRERVIAVGGNLDVHPATQGVRILARLPLVAR